MPEASESTGVLASRLPMPRRIQTEMNSRIVLPVIAAALLTFGCNRQHAADQPDRGQQSSNSADQQQDGNNKARTTGEKIGETAREAEIRTRGEREKIKQGAIDLAAKTKVAAEGVVEGWRAGNLTDINTATRERLVQTGLSEAEANNVIAHRPYQSKQELVDRKVISAASYRGIQDQVAVRHK